MSKSDEEEDFEIVIKRIEPTGLWFDPVTGEPTKPRLMTREEFMELYPRTSNV